MHYPSVGHMIARCVGRCLMSSREFNFYMASDLIEIYKCNKINAINAIKQINAIFIRKLVKDLSSGESS